ncbi:Aldehyde reductase [Intoshia linei]|uniref:Aldehyde reductase n=1 Tax=Intoshia linei TaxID=1819745 RepID=A0A177AT78_9BILA|nr:Aldehyde reductase [Intoshia linei]
MSDKKYTLSEFTKVGSVHMPMFGVGSYNIDDVEIEENILSSIKAGYRMIDVSEFNHNEIGIGKAIRSCNVPRSELFIIGRIWRRSVLTVEATIKASIEKLGIGYYDLYLLSNPMVDLNMEIYKKVQEIKEKTDLIREFGVSNFYPQHFIKIRAVGLKLPIINSLELHPYRSQDKVVKFCKSNGIAVMSHCSLAGGFKLASKEMKKISEQVGKSAAQIMLRWSLDNGYPVITRATSNIKKIQENTKIFDIVLPVNIVKQMINFPHFSCCSISIACEKHKFNFFTNLFIEAVSNFINFTFSNSKTLINTKEIMQSNKTTINRASTPIRGSPDICFPNLSPVKRSAMPNKCKSNTLVQKVKYDKNLNVFVFNKKTFATIFAKKMDMNENIMFQSDSDEKNE